MIIPSIIGKNIAEIKEKIEAVKEHTKWVQIDVMDGMFVPFKTWPYTEGSIGELELLSSVRTDDLKIDVHLMVSEPEKVVEEWVDHGADRIVFHYEATKKISEIITFLEGEGAESCIALRLETPIAVLEKYLGDFDSVLLLDIKEPGSYGQEFQETVFEKIREVKERYPGVLIEADGGINIDNIKKLSEAGVENFVVGSAIFGKKDKVASIKELKEKLG